METLSNLRYVAKHALAYRLDGNLIPYLGGIPVRAPFKQRCQMTSILISAILALFSCNINAYEFPLGHFLPQDTYILCFTMRDEKCSDLLINLITSAQKSIDMQAYHLTDKNIIAAL